MVALKVPPMLGIHTNATDGTIESKKDAKDEYALPVFSEGEDTVRSQVVIRWREYSRLNSTGESSEWLAAWIMVALIGCYVSACLTYDRLVCAANTPEKVPDVNNQSNQLRPTPATPLVKQARMQSWDFMRYALQIVVIAGHIDEKLYRNLDAKFSYWPASVKMNGFMFVSGVFGSSMEKDSIAKMLCYTAGTSTMLTMLVFAVNRIHDPFQDYDEQSAVTAWYLVVLCACRFSITPMFHICRKQDVPVVMPLLLTTSLCYVVRAPIDGFHDLAGDHVFIPWMLNQYTFFAPFFALGLCLRVSEWNELMQNWSVYWFSVAFVVAYVAGLIFFDSFRQWNDASCLYEWQCTVTTHYPDSVIPPYHLGLSTFLNWHRVLALRASIGCTTLCVIGNMVAPMARLFPSITENIAGLGTRTIYSYVLHWPFIIVLGLKMHVDLILHAIPEPIWPLFCVGMTVTCAAMFSCRLTETLFKWMILPYWLQDVFWNEWLCCVRKV